MGAGNPPLPLSDDQEGRMLRLEEGVIGEENIIIVFLTCNRMQGHLAAFLQVYSSSTSLILRNTLASFGDFNNLLPIS